MLSLSLKFKLTLSAISMALLLLLVQSISQFYMLRSELSARIESEQFTLLTELAGHLDDKMDERLNALSHAAGSIPQNRLADIKALEEHLKGETALLTLFDDLYIFDAQGILLADWPFKTRTTRPRHGRPGLHPGRAQARCKPVISQPILGKATNQPIVVLAAPVLNPKGELVAIAGGVLNLYKPNLIGSLGTRQIGENGYFYMVSQERLVISHPGPHADHAKDAAGQDRQPGAGHGPLQGFEGRWKEPIAAACAVCSPSSGSTVPVGCSPRSSPAKRLSAPLPASRKTWRCSPCC